MEALGRKEEAQAFRWQCFERTLDSGHLRAYLRRLPPFKDIDVEERAMSAAFGFSEVHQALAFLVSWPALEKAAGLVLARAKELNGDHYEILSSAADVFAAQHPLAATLLLRAMIEFALTHNRVKRYRHAARHLAECERLASAVSDFRNFEPHERYRDRLKSEHGRKTRFGPSLRRQRIRGSVPPERGLVIQPMDNQSNAATKRVKLPSKHDPIREAVHIIDHSKEFYYFGGHVSRVM